MDTSEKTGKTPSKTENKVRVKKTRSAKLDRVTHLYLQEGNLTKIVSETLFNNPYHIKFHLKKNSPMYKAHKMSKHSIYTTIK